MFEFTKTLMTLSKFKLEKGHILLFNMPHFLIPVESWISLQKGLETEGKFSFIYDNTIESFITWLEALEMQTKAPNDKVLEWASKSIGVGGIGAISYNIDREAETFTAKLKDSSIAKAYGKSKGPVCEIARSIVAAGASFAFSKRYDAKELKCLAKGDKYCFFDTFPKK